MVVGDVSKKPTQVRARRQVVFLRRQQRHAHPENERYAKNPDGANKFQANSVGLDQVSN